MEFTLLNTHDSINNLRSPKDLPDFLVLTGKNGSGKTHILEAIRDGDIQVRIDEAIAQSPEILYVKFGDLVVTGGDSYSYQQATQACDNVWGNFTTWRSEYFRNGRNMDFVQFIQRYRNDDPNQNRLVDSVEFTIDNEPNTDIKNITRHHIWIHIFDPASGTANIDFFEQNFAKLFAEYQISIIKQRFYKHVREEGYEDAPSISEDELRRLEAEKPWDFVNKVLEAAKFDFRVMPPNFWETEGFEYKISLKKISTGAEVVFDKLSTGEKVLFAMALVRYKAEKRTKIFPRIIMFDEPDAPLHPGMTENLLDVLENVFVKEYNTRVIITTHSPATVAMAPENSVYLTQTKKGNDQHSVTTIMPSSKNDALNTLSSGFIATSSEANQEQVQFRVSQSAAPILFVEGKTDIPIIEAAWKKLIGGALPFTIIDCGNAEEIKQKVNR